jgi:amino acid transporter
VDTRTSVTIGIGVVAFVIVVLAATAAVVVPRYRRAQWHPELLGTHGPISIVAFVGVVVIGTLALAFSLQSAGVPHPATIACVFGAAAVVLGGPILMRRLRSIMLQRL